MENFTHEYSKYHIARYNEKEVEKLCSQESGQWWRSIKQMAGIQVKESSILTLANNVTSGDLHELAGKANNYFISVSDGLQRLVPLKLDHHIDVPDKYTISAEDVQDQLLKINTKKAIGPDYLPNWILRDFADVLAGPIASIYNSSIAQASVPTIWKSADIVPLPKVNPPTEIEKHLRPIALTPVLAKIMEGFICRWLEELCPDADDSLQFGCVKGTSTTHCLIELVHNWSMATDSTGNYVRILLLDFSRAFDHIDHQLLLDKWSEPQVPPFMIHWKHSFLCDRQQRVKINNCVSDWKSPSGGTPQGTKSGARDFKKVVQDMQSQLPLYKYVDDTTLSELCTRNSQSVVLQESANEIKEWCDKNKMIINTKKTKEIVINFLKTDINIT